MTDAVKDFIKLISESDNPEKSLGIAIDVIVDFLTQCVEAQQEFLADRQERSLKA